MVEQCIGNHSHGSSFYTVEVHVSSFFAYAKDLIGFISILSKILELTLVKIDQDFQFFFFGMARSGQAESMTDLVLQGVFTFDDTFGKNSRGLKKLGIVE